MQIVLSTRLMKNCGVMVGGGGGEDEELRRMGIGVAQYGVSSKWSASVEICGGA